MASNLRLMVRQVWMVISCSFPIRRWDEAEAGKMYAVSLQMKFRGTVIGSNYFNVKVADDFSAVAEDLGGVTIKAGLRPERLCRRFQGNDNKRS